MLGKERLERYRTASPEERYAEFSLLMEKAFNILEEMSPHQRTRTLEVWNYSNDMANGSILRKFSRLKNG